ncbi:MAG: translation initiation factor [Candidatus Woesearchaeota archaeon]|jgi:translation initiation factor 1|nr:translation initiation factor [Candidatus Woesearchaeota archaeon]MDP6265539.1 translation initiation factor [Candidatus Woesearchaeota archaeon]MDP7322780.1 translation initiation factor [Candidatus Woesearchaeota archaeon]MDP7476034.1 translation initiation factor [Candidatus Woesearchaeota archaeon]HJO01910.1 translation initiation factor [Candidatus Woesearchaeota archaeon]|tara:strand:+ start:6871 stop:7179 length:309 start_codon:yes stop_codon:yes gene_type:complete
MGEICTKCGLVKELCVCETIAKESQLIKVFLENKKFRKVYTIIEGIDQKEIGIKDLAKKLKAQFACGGTAKEGKIELQGNHKNKVKAILVDMGFSPDSIEIK